MKLFLRTTSNFVISLACSETTGFRKSFFFRKYITILVEFSNCHHSMNLQTNSSVCYSLHFFCWWIRLVQTCTSTSQLPSQVPRFSFSLSLNDHVLITCGISYLSISMLSNPLNGFSPYTWLRFVFSKSSNTRAQYVRFAAGLFPPNSAGSVSRWQWSWSVALLLPCKCI